MNLHGIISGSVGCHQPQMMVSYICLHDHHHGSTRWSANASYAPAQQVLAQVQELTAADLKHLDDLTMSGLKRKLWSSQLMNGIDRAAGLWVATRWSCLMDHVACGSDP